MLILGVALGQVAVLVLCRQLAGGISPAPVGDLRPWHPRRVAAVALLAASLAAVPLVLR